MPSGSKYVDFPGSSDGKVSTYQAGDPGSIPGQKDLLEKEMATHSSILAWKIPWTEEPGKLQSHGVAESDMTEQLNFTFTFNWHLIRTLSFTLTTVP